MESRPKKIFKLVYDTNYTDKIRYAITLYEKSKPVLMELCLSYLLGELFHELYGLVNISETTFNFCFKLS